MYFQNFPAIYYEYEIGGKKVLRTVTDITQNIRVVSSILDSITLYDEYDIMDGETPEIISNKIYGSPLYHWIIIIANQRFNYLEDWPMPTDQLETYIKNKYGDQMYATRYHINSDGYIVNSTEPGSTPISNYDHEQQANESKRRIKIISPNLLNRILIQFNDLI